MMPRYYSSSSEDELGFSSIMPIRGVDRLDKGK